MSPGFSCPLCDHKDIYPSLVENQYGECPRCALRFLSPQLRLDPAEERERYLLHTDDLFDPGYRNYLSPLFHALREKLPGRSRGLDYGSGRAPVLAQMLREEGHAVECYDPYFAAKVPALDATYDFVVSTEVVEHFFSPATEFRRLRQLTRPGGTLGITTLLYDGTDFSSWFYRRDPTHVTLYCRQTFEWIQKNMGWERAEIIGNKTILLS